jgi:hypothetical protein
MVPLMMTGQRSPSSSNGLEAEDRGLRVERVGIVHDEDVGPAFDDRVADSP